MRFLFILVALLGACQAISQGLKVQPFIQDASPHQVFIHWETESEDESIIEWGLEETLGNIATGSSIVSQGNARIHEVSIEGLSRFTQYYYRIKTNTIESDIYSFKTPPFASDNESFKLIAMSDMQRDGSFPNKFNEIVEEGVIKYLTEESGELVDNVALIMIPGDLVVNGNNYNSWTTEFFTPSEKLISQIPVYPVPGNHENNANFFFQYFKLPTNGTPGFEEHWWYKDYGNVRIVGLDSNGSFAGDDQLAWLDEILLQTCVQDSIDFVFAQLHHPHKSELWTPGESNFTGEVIERLENFSSDCNKPSIHFFGHTHGYSRGQSRDHKHLWINVATAGGAIDNWGEFPNLDYDEFSVSQDEYGFVSVEVNNEAEPTLTIKRISRGDQDQIIDNVLSDSLVLYKQDNPADEPIPEYPINIGIPTHCVTLKAGPFSSSLEGAEHGQSHWQVTNLENGFSEPIFESWKNYENWYFDVDTQAEDDLTDEEVFGLSANAEYIWRVRYRDRNLNWSPWSATSSFETTQSGISGNLIINPGAEDSLTNWAITEGVVEAVLAGECNGINPRSGDYYFAVGGLCDHSEVGQLVQNIDISDYTDSISMGLLDVQFGAYLSNFSGSDQPSMRLLLLDENDQLLSESSTLSSTSNNWTLFSETLSLPVNCRRLQIELTGTRFNGTDNDSYFDDVFVELLPSDTDCDMTSTTSAISMDVPTLNMIPNPVSFEGYIHLGESKTNTTMLHVMNSLGQKVSINYEVLENSIRFQREHLPSGSYSFVVRNEKAVIGQGKFIII